MKPRSNLSDNITVILHRSSVPDNVGAVARVMRNTGFSRLILSQPAISDWDKAMRVAVSAAGLVADAPRTDSLPGAIEVSGARFVAGTTGRDRRYWDPVPVGTAAGQILERVPAGVALVFGPEDRGLSNEDLTLCHLRLTIPAVGLASYNLSHAAAIVLFTVMAAGAGHRAPEPSPAASFAEMEGMYGHMEELLTEVEFLHRDNPEHMMRAVRDFINRAEPTSREATSVRGVCRRLLWHLRNRK